MNQLGIVHPSMFTSLAPAFYPSLLTIQATTETRSATGAVINTWANVAGMVTVACRLAPASARETRAANQVLTVDTWTCDVAQALAGVTTKQRALVDTVVYDVIGVEYDGENPRHSTRLTLKVVT